MANKVLVIDDSLMVRKQVGTALAKAGFTVVEACDGADALEKLAANDDVRLAVCDVNMPRMSGIEFLEQAPKTLPVMMLTTEGQPELMVRARELGAKGWLIKPFKPEILVAAATRLAGSP